MKTKSQVVQIHTFMRGHTFITYKKIVFEKADPKIPLADMRSKFLCGKSFYQLKN